MYNVIKDIAEFCRENNKLGKFKVIIFFFIIFQKLMPLIPLDLNELNKLLENNRIQIINPHSRYSNFEDALKASEEKIFEIDKNGNKISEEYLIPYTYSFYDTLTSESARESSNALLYETNMDKIYNREFDSY
ncbi:hypothetical protein F8M41_006908 [Gigaspora margarita]|uniref:Uncharacterized protein n=1 Tax=Gigaspora margarita TaxID=4874 RepID=A0A8H3X7J8_GIGMA|nr:hypothetical protein F8M41_006908 [Gigaspora margarita]